MPPNEEVVPVFDGMERGAIVTDVDFVQIGACITIRDQRLERKVVGANMVSEVELLPIRSIWFDLFCYSQAGVRCPCESCQ